MRRDVLVHAEHVDEEAGLARVQPSGLHEPLERLHELEPISMPAVDHVVRGGEKVRIAVAGVRESLVLALLHEAPVALLRRLREAPLQR